MAEIVDAFEKEGQYFGVVGIEVGGIHEGYRALRKVLQLRPFDVMSGIKQRYFFTGTYYKTQDSSNCGMYVRVEQGREGKQIDIGVPKDLLANLIWFGKIEDFSEAAHLLEVT